MSSRDEFRSFWADTRDATAYNASIVPTVIKKTSYGERGVDIFSQLLDNRIVFIGTPINDLVANVTVAQLLFLESESKKQDISLYIHSPGGLITSGLAIYDTMQLIRCDVSTYVVGHAFSMAAVLLAGGTKGKRYALPHSRVMLHQPFIGGIEGTASDLSIHAEEMVKMRLWINEILAKHSGQPLERVEKDADQEYFMSAEEAVAYGLVDEILSSSSGE